MARGRLASWFGAALCGALLGLLVLGLGGRAAMRVIAVSGGAAPTATFEGTLTVLLAGAGSGLMIVFAAAFLLTWRRVTRHCSPAGKLQEMAQGYVRL